MNNQHECLKMSSDGKRILGKRHKIPSPKKLIIQEGVEEIGYGTLFQCDELEEVSMPSTLKEIGDHAFASCSNLKILDLSKTNNLVICEGAFASCDKLEKIIFPESIDIIDEYAFANCKALKEVELNNVKTIANVPFHGCENLNKITIKNSSKYSDMGCNVIYDKEENSLIQGCNASKIPEETKIIKRSAFAYTKLKEIILPESTKEIREEAFSDCSFDNLILNNGLLKIKAKAFSGSSSIKRLTIPSSVTYIGNDAFSWLENLEEVYVEGNTWIEQGAFYNCNSLKNIFIYSKEAKISILLTNNEEANIYVPNDAKCDFLIKHCHNKIIPTSLLDMFIEQGRTMKDFNNFCKKIDIER